MISSASVGAASARVARVRRTRDARERSANLARGVNVDARGGRVGDARERARAGVKVRNDFVARVDRGEERVWALATHGGLEVAIADDLG